MRLFQIDHNWHTGNSVSIKTQYSLKLSSWGWIKCYGSHIEPGNPKNRTTTLLDQVQKVPLAQYSASNCGQQGTSKKQWHSLRREAGVPRSMALKVFSGLSTGVGWGCTYYTCYPSAWSSDCRKECSSHPPLALIGSKLEPFQKPREWRARGRVHDAIKQGILSQCHCVTALLLLLSLTCTAVTKNAGDHSFFGGTVTFIMQTDSSWQVYLFIFSLFFPTPLPRSSRQCMWFLLHVCPDSNPVR